VATNRAYQEMVGYTGEELQNMTFLDITNEDDRHTNWELRTQLLEGQRPEFTIEKRYRRKNGQEIWVRSTASLIPGTAKLSQLIMALTEDITDRKRAERALRR